MSIVKTAGYTDTPIEGVSSLTMARAILNFGKDFRIKSETPGKEVILTNITSSTEAPEKIRIAYSDVTNIYNGTGIDSSLSAPTKAGVSLLNHVTNVITISDSTDPAFRIDLPLSAHMVLKLPRSQYITAADVKTLIGRLLSSYFDAGVVTDARLEALLRGSLTPAEL